MLAHIENILSFMDLFCQQQLDEVSGRWVADLAQMGSLRHLDSRCLTIFFKSWTHLMPKGRLPVMSSKVSTPTAQRSTVSSYFSAEMSSGDRYKGVPQKVPLSSLLGLYTLHPKSVSLISPPGATNMFSGLMSRWMMLFRWRKSTAWQICLTIPCTYFKVKPDLRDYIREYSVFRPAYYWIR